jgi:acetyl esterase/lipase
MSTLRKPFQERIAGMIGTTSTNYAVKPVLFLLFLSITPSPAADTLKIACVGNSITQGDGLANPATQGYVALLQKMLGNNYRVMNYGLSGRTMLTTASQPYSKESKFRELFTVKPDIITIALGTNESRPSVWTTEAAYMTDYSRFIDSLETISNANSPHPLILPVLCTPATDNNTYTISGTIIANQILPAIRTVAKTKGDSVIDAHTPFLPLMKLIRDGVHPDSSGNKVLADIFYENLQNLALKQSPPTRWLWYGRPPAGAPGALGNDSLDKPMLYMFPAPDSNRNGAAVIICPGGAYTGLPVMMSYEGFDEAKWFNTFGVTAFVLRYRYSPYRHPIEMNDAKRAMRTIRYYAASYGIDTTRIGLMGFSAGGHLASTVGTHFDAGKPADPDPIERKKSRPDFLVLVYPVITLTTPYTHTGSRDALLGVPANAALVDSLSNQKWVTAQTPQTFLAHGDADDAVPIQNSRLFDSACKAFQVPDTLVVDPGKGHAYGMAGIWPDALKNWMLKRGLLTKQVGIEQFQAKRRPVEHWGSVRYSPTRGIYFTRSTIQPDVVQVLTLSGACLASYNGTIAGDFSWKSRTRGMYLVRILSGKDVFIGKIMCSGK